MKRLVPLAVLFAVLTFPASALAQGDEPPPLPPPSPPPPSSPPPTTPGAARPAPPPVAPAAPAERRTPPPPTMNVDQTTPRPHAGAPAAHTGFQLGLRTGLSVPMGAASRGNTMFNTYGSQVPLIIDIGGKPTPHLFLGAYLGVAGGGVNGTFADQCDRINARCASASARIGLEVQYQFSPARRANPWIGYGVGFEAANAVTTKGGITTSYTTWGLEFARLGGGVDFRLSRVIGVGPFVDLTFARYAHVKADRDGDVFIDATIEDRRVHEWLSLGGRLVFFP